MSDLFAPDGGWRVRILDLSGGAQDNIVEEIGGFETLMQANAFARRYVRDSVERCRVPGMNAKEVLEAWFAFGEDAEVIDAANPAGAAPPSLAISSITRPAPRIATGARSIRGASMTTKATMSEVQHARL